MSKLIKVVFLCCLFQSILSKRKFDPILIELAKGWHNACELFTGETNQMIEDVLEGIFDEKNMIGKRYMVCLWMFSGAMNEKGVIDLKHINKNIPSADEKEVQTYAFCNKEGLEKGKGDLLESVFQQQKCLFKHLKKEKYIFF